MNTAPVLERPPKTNLTSQYYSPVVAFLQNPWFPPGTKRRILDGYAHDIRIRTLVLGQSRTGIKLRRAFTDDLFDEVWWDNANPTAGDHRRSSKDADLEHMERIIRLVQPRSIIGFGKTAENGLRAIIEKSSLNDLIIRGLAYTFAPHPGAFDVATPIVLRDVARQACIQAGWSPPPKLIKERSRAIHE